MAEERPFGCFHKKGRSYIYVKFGTLTLDVVQIHRSDLPMEIGKTVRIRHLAHGSKWEEFTPDSRRAPGNDYWMWCGLVGSVIGHYPYPFSSRTEN